MHDWRKRLPVGVCGLLSVLLAFYLLFAGGCNMEPSQQIAYLQQAVETSQAAIGLANEEVKRLEAKLALAQQQGSDDKTLAAIQQVLQEALTHRAQVDATLQAAKDALEKAKADQSPAPVLDVAAAVGQAVTQAIGGTAGGYGAIVTAGLGVLALFFRRKATTATARANDAEGQLTESENTVGALSAANGDYKDLTRILTRAVEALPVEQQAAMKAAISKAMAKASTLDTIVNEAKAG